MEGLPSSVPRSIWGACWQSLRVASEPALRGALRGGAKHLQLRVPGAVSARTKAEAALATSEVAEDAAEAQLEAVLRELERGQPGPSGVKVKAE